MNTKPSPMTVAEWLDSPTADPPRRHVLAAVREAYPDAVEMATAFIRVRPSEAWEAFAYGVMSERAIASEPKAHDLTPSEVAAAKMIAAYLEWMTAPSDMRAAGDAFSVVANFAGNVYLDGCGDFTDKGRALLDRARKAGVL